MKGVSHVAFRNPDGTRAAILTNAGGPAVLATDALISDGGSLTELSPETVESLNKFLPFAWSRRPAPQASAPREGRRGS